MINPNHVQTILKMFYTYLPIGTNYFTLTYRLNLEIEEWVDTYDYLYDEGLIEDWANGNKQIITLKGIRSLTDVCKYKRMRIKHFTS